MKIIVTAKSEDIDETAQFCMDFIMDNPDLEPVGYRCMSNGTSLILEK